MKDMAKSGDVQKYRQSVSERLASQQSKRSASTGSVKKSRVASRGNVTSSQDAGQQ